MPDSYDTYSHVPDLLVGDVVIAADIKQRHVNNATDEVDSKLGFDYPTPFTPDNTSRQGWLLIKRLANFYASGRLLLEIAQVGEQQQINSYGKSLVDQADEVVACILKGDINLSPESVEPDPVQNQFLIQNLDPVSQVEAFYGYIAQPTYPFAGQPFGGWPRG